jgi:hypothetical protein
MAKAVVWMARKLAVVEESSSRALVMGPPRRASVPRMVGSQ